MSAKVKIRKKRFNNAMQAITLFAIVMSLTGCRTKFYGMPGFMKPGRSIMALIPKNMSPIYNYGWKHGCESGLASMSNSLYRTFYQFKMDPAMRRHGLEVAKIGLYRREWAEAANSANKANSSYAYQNAVKRVAIAKKRLENAQYAKRENAGEYYKAWKDAYDYCRNYIHSRLRQADERYELSSNNKFLFPLLANFGNRSILEHGLLNFWGDGKSSQARPLRHMGYIAGNSTIGDGYMQWDFSQPHYIGTPMVWDFRPKEGFVW